MKILMVCLGNICRSPLAEGILRSKIASQHKVASAGTISVHQGEQPDIRSIDVAKNKGIDISHQKANHFTPNYFDEFDKILCMDLNNKKDVLAMAVSDEQRNKVSLILEEAGVITAKEVPDPYYGNAKDFEDVFRQLDYACDAIAEKYQLK